MHRSLVALALVVSATACVTEELDDVEVGGADAALTALSPRERAALIKRIRQRLPSRGIVAPPAPVIPGTPARQAALIALGQALVFDKILSDNHDVSCMTCHPASLGSDDDRTLSAGVRGIGLGVDRQGGVVVGRHAPPLYNLHGLDSFFWDGRVERLPDGRYRTPAGAQLTPAMTSVFELGAASAIGLFPVTSREEMREQRLDGRFDDLTAIADGNYQAIWSALMARLRAIPRYRELFGDAYPSWPGSRLERIDTMTFAHASNAMAAFFVARFASTDSAWDRFLAGDSRAFEVVDELSALLGQASMTGDAALRGADIFLDTCATCHRGPLFTDGRFHNTLLPQVGPGVGDGAGGRDDYGRAHVLAAGDPDARCGAPGSAASCRYAFRTPPLRNVLLTGPYGHAGQFGRFAIADDFTTTVRHGLDDLRRFTFHYTGDVASHLVSYGYDQLDPALRDSVLDNRAEIAAHADPLFVAGADGGFHLATFRADPLIAFLAALTSTSLLERGLATDSPRALAACDVVPATVPSGLPIDDASGGGCE